MTNSTSRLITFRTGCTPETGTGHLRRCMTLAEELRFRRFDVCLVTEDNSLSRNIAKEYQGAVEYVPSHLLLPDHVTKPGALILDFPPSPNSLLDQQNILLQLSSLNDAGVNIISLGHVGRNSQSFRAVIDLYPSQQIYAANYFEGPEFLILRSEFQEDPGDLKKDPCVLISMGGSDPHDLTEVALTNLAASGYKGDVLVILGAGYSPQRENNLQKKTTEAGFSVRVYRDIIDMRTMMRQANAAIVAFGTTAYELMSQRVPVMVYTHYQWQISSAKLFEELGCCVYLGCAENSGEIASLSPRIKEFLHNLASMQQISQKAREIVDGKGAARVADLVENMVAPEKEEQLLDVLFVLAHPGDELLGCGGTLLRHVYHGDRVGLVVLGDGVSSRQKEFDDAASMMAAKRNCGQPFRLWWDG
ncbi:MAG: PIG-L family deacetylase [Desulfobacterales bacterium]